MGGRLHLSCPDKGVGALRAPRDPPAGHRELARDGARLRGRLTPPGQLLAANLHRVPPAAAQPAAETPRPANQPSPDPSVRPLLAGGSGGPSPAVQEPQHCTVRWSTGGSWASHSPLAAALTGRQHPRLGRGARWRSGAVPQQPASLAGGMDAGREVVPISRAEGRTLPQHHPCLRSRSRSTLHPQELLQRKRPSALRERVWGGQSGADGATPAAKAKLCKGPSRPAS